MQKFLKVSLFFGSLLAIIVVFYFKLGFDTYLPNTSQPVNIQPNEHQSIDIQTQDVKTKANQNKLVQTKTAIDWSTINIDKVEVYKSARRVDLLQKGQVVQSYPMRLGFTPDGHKTTEGDGKTPEGKYTLDWRNPNSQFYKSLHISYPNQQDIKQAKARGVSAGGDVMIHGTAKKTGGSIGQPFYDYLPKGDWTLGCISVSNKNMDEIWENIKNGTEIEIFP